VSTDRLTESGYFCAKLAQEQLIQGSSIPYTIVHATQFFEFMNGIADDATDGNTVRLRPALIQPMAADDVASALAQVAVSPPLNRIVEIANPDQFRLDELIRGILAARNDPREVVTDPQARYFGIARLRTILGSKLPSLSVGVLTWAGPCSVQSVLDVEPLRVFPVPPGGSWWRSYPRWSVSSTSIARSTSRFVNRESKPPWPTISSSLLAPANSSSTSSSGSLERRSFPIASRIPGDGRNTRSNYRTNF
jgi:hypothetical protein